MRICLRNVPNRVPEITCLLVCLLALSVLTITVGFSKQALTYDEPYYLGQVAILKQAGFTPTFLKLLPGPAGPLYAMVHYVFEPLTRLEQPGVRLVNIFFLLLTIFVLTLLLGLEKSQQPLLASLSIIGLPITPVIAGMALTELPSMFFVCLSALLIRAAIMYEHTRSMLTLVLSLAGGLALGISVLGRQPYLILLLALPFLLISSRDGRAKRLKILLAFIFGVAILVVPVFYLWGGLVPPATARVGRGISAKHGMLSFVYAGCLCLILAPKWFSLNKNLIIAIVVLVGAINMVFGFLLLTPNASVLGSLLSDQAIKIFSRSVSGVLVALGIMFILSSIKNMWVRQSDARFLFYCAGAMFVVASATQVTHIFSSRYTGMAIPFLLIITEEYSRNNYWKAARILGGFLLGMLSLISYYGYIPNSFGR